MSRKNGSFNMNSKRMCGKATKAGIIETTFTAMNVLGKHSTLLSYSFIIRSLLNKYTVQSKEDLFFYALITRINFEVISLVTSLSLLLMIY